MVRINLLSKPEKKKRAGLPSGLSAPRISIPSGAPLPLLGGILMVVLLSGAVFLWVRQNARVGELGEQIDLARQDSTRYSRAITKIREIETTRSAVVARIEAIQAVDQGRFRSGHLLEELSRALPPDTWLTSVIRKDEGGEERIEITGVTYSNLTLTQFMTGLESSPYLEGVGLIGSNRSVVDGVDVTSFALVARHSQPTTS
jgi:type IV pilus assembly protein PilN